MKNTDKIKMTVDVAGIPVSLFVPFDEQDAVRDTEKGIKDLYNNWRARFPNKSQEALIAMIAYQYASYYHALSIHNDNLADSVRNTINKIDNALKLP
ncbi:MAG: cell division protein ZapA [Prevotella sp.]|nr:cell division protein ZapA [Bacteroides sp.]MCM1366756.1 cell division protein ZapA [Prevotella sp.]MCM1437375.1 cell division protein ZapA [Prevotella sp.]